MNEQKNPKAMFDSLIDQQNNFKDKLIANVLDLKRHLEIKKENPKYSRPDQMGRPVGIDQLIETYQKGIENSRNYLKSIEELIALESEEKINPEIDKMLEWKPSGIVTEEGKVPGKIKGGK